MTFTSPRSSRGRRRHYRRPAAVAAAVGLALSAAGLTTAGAADSASGPDAPGTRTAAAARPMESLDRGVVAVRADADSVFVSWRLLGLEPEGTGFNVYRSTAGGSWTKLNAATLTKGTNFTDDGADLTRENRYRVKAVVAGSEGAASAAFTLTADHADEPAVRIPLRDGGSIKYAWVGDLDGDGAYDFVIDRTAATQGLEAYTSKGTFLWAVDMGPNSADQDNIEPGSAAISTGHWDGVTVYDFDGDGRAEVAVRVGDGVTFGDGTVHEEADDVRQSIAILDGRTGAPRATAPVPGDYASDGPMGARFGVGHLDGTTPSLVAYMKNRVGSGGFNLMYTAWRFDGDELTRQWKWLRGDRAASDGHNTRIIDVDGDGTDEIAEIGFLLDGDGTLRYSLADQGIGHGDRFHIGDLDPARPGLEGYGVQQDHPGGLREYYYDARTGTVLWKHVESGVTDVGRGLAADIDPRHSGMEVWSFSGIHNARSNRLTEPDTSLAPWPQLAFQWDGDLSSELLNNGRFEQWDPENPKPSGSLPRLLSTWTYGAADASGGYNPLLYGDILGDWREEAVYKNTDDDELIVFTTDIPTDTRLYTPAHNPAYRNAMTLHGYMQSHHTDYYLGSGMATPPRPDIAYVTT